MELNKDLWAEILRRLPGDELLLFRSVCKSWYSLISSPAFIGAQFLSSSSSIESKPYLFLDINCPNWYAWYNPDQFNPSESKHCLGFQTLPFDYPHVSSTITDVINGVVCLSMVYYSDLTEPYTGHTVLWNPAIRKFLHIPRRDSMLDVGFGFDCRSNDFKVVRRNTNWAPTTLEVYSYREGCSRTVNSDHIRPFDLVRDDSCFRNGAIHWIIRLRNCSTLLILRFDCESEELTTMDLPQGFNQPGLIVNPGGICVRFGKVSVLEVTEMEGADKGEAAVWVMEEYGDPTSWKKTAYHKDIAWISQKCILKLVDGTCSGLREANEEEGIKRSQPPWNGHVFEPSLFLMDTERVTTRGSKIIYSSFRMIND